MTFLSFNTRALRTDIFPRIVRLSRNNCHFHNVMPYDAAFLITDARATSRTVGEVGDAMEEGGGCRQFTGLNRSPHPLGVSGV